ncbi:hypothetical protein AB0P36_35515 [Streptomyces flavidovirens]|uniref:hypothetical protein n=1 Tax=Streptomyces flavidovirens TaxID=67298 RepID=UPI00343EC9D9
MKKVFFLTETDALLTAGRTAHDWHRGEAADAFGEQTLDYENSTMTAQITDVHGRLSVTTLTGRLDQTTDWQLRNVVADCMARDLPVVVLDLALLDFCDEAASTL